MADPAPFACRCLCPCAPRPRPRLRPGRHRGALSLLVAVVTGISAAIAAAASPTVALLPALCVAAPGDTVTVDLVADPGSSQVRLGAYEARLSWDPAVLQPVAIEPDANSGFAAPLSRQGPGWLVISQFRVDGAAGPCVLARLRFRAHGAVGDTARLALTVPVADAAYSFASLADQLQVTGAQVLTAFGSDPGGLSAWLSAAPAAAAVGGQVRVSAGLYVPPQGPALGAYEAALTWDASVLELSGLTGGGALGGMQTHAEPGRLRFSQFGVAGAYDTLAALEARFTVVSGRLANTWVTLSVPIADAAGTFADLTGQLQPAAPVAIEVLDHRSRPYDLAAGWHLVSLPCRPGDLGLQALFPEALSLFVWAGSYVAASEFSPGLGGWLHLAGPAQGSLAGVAWAPQLLTRVWPAGWSLVAPGDTALSVAGLQAAQPGLEWVYGWNGTYQLADILVPGRAYWVRLSRPAVLDLSGRVAAAAPARVAASQGDPGGLSAPAFGLWFEGPTGSQRLVLDATPADIRPLPPIPPTPLFDVRVVLGGGVEAWQVPPGTDPRRVRWQGQVDRVRWSLPTDARWRLGLDGTWVALHGQGEVPLAGVQQVSLSGPPVGPAWALLHPCYPNPFNAATTVSYELATPGQVQLTVYAANGQRVRWLVHGYQGAGLHRAVWDGRDDAGGSLASGVYLCELATPGTRQVRRVALLQ